MRKRKNKDNKLFNPLERVILSIVVFLFAVVIIYFGMRMLNEVMNQSLKMVVHGSEVGCMNRAIASIKKEPQCTTFVTQINQIPNGNCLSGATIGAVSQIMDRAKTNMCIAPPDGMEKMKIDAINKMANQINTSCIKNFIARIKKDGQCEVFVNQINAIQNPSCSSGGTHNELNKIITNARANMCLIN